MKCILFIFLSCFYLNCYSQAINSPDNAKARQSVFLELGKNGLIYNIGYDRQFEGKKTGFRAVAGSNFGKYHSLFNIGGGIYRLFGKSKKYFETGADIYYLNVNEISDDQVGIGNLVYPDYPTKTFYATANIGYRYSSGRRLFRIGISPGITKDEFIPGGYISFGIGF